ncbi:4287_t:CDS:1, partial [Racocetra persica]
AKSLLSNLSQSTTSSINHYFVSIFQDNKKNCLTENKLEKYLDIKKLPLALQEYLLLVYWKKFKKEFLNL